MFWATATAPVAPVVGQHAPNSPGLWGAMLALLLVLALIVGLAWLLKRLPGSGLRQNAQLRIVASLTVGQRERVMVVEVGGQQVLLGVTPHQITPLHTLDNPLTPIPAASVTLPPFAQLLASKLRKDASDVRSPR